MRHDEELLDLYCELPERVHGYVIAPMLLIPFVENAFKYSPNSTGYKINIHLSVKDGLLDFTTQNTINPNNRRPDRVGGIGLKNVQRRLDLMYPKRHQLTLNDDGETYTSNLKINLK
jgi:sensor histidine kinase YesM